MIEAQRVRENNGFFAMKKLIAFDMQIGENLLRFALARAGNWMIVDWS